LDICGEELLPPHATSKLEDHPFSAVHSCLFNIIAATYLIRRPSPLSATRGRYMPWWQGPKKFGNIYHTRRSFK